ncbi:hypothetical protein [Desulfonema magnum]|uniref:Uncharacterized protein n=1 Tax=Desulfonema magnum TaxID=45655 RepID=A0A975GMS5_9BACT|nr:hypothetical protein [Desulfonema magnum]QTA86113.1 Uncharacterized protein dnm_021310 [Desulfonema magnum]
MKKILVVVLALMLAVSIGCGKKDKPDKKVMNKLASSLTKLASAVESTVRYKKPPKGISDQELLKLATKHDPRLLEPFKEYTVKVSQKNRHAIVLVCTKDGKRGLLEDAGCSGPMDKHLWETSSSCKFTLTVDDVCKK